VRAEKKKVYNIGESVIKKSAWGTRQICTTIEIKAYIHLTKKF
jgi:hypothetical protein